jgi:hypothetical protein
VSESEKLEARKVRKWFACTMDDGIVASGTTLKELLRKLGRTSAKYTGNGTYEVTESNSTRGWHVWIYGNKAELHRNGFGVDEPHNTWYYDELAESYETEG